MANNLEVVVRIRDLTTQGLAKITQSISRMGASITGALGAAAGTMVRWTSAIAGLSGAFSAVKMVEWAENLEELQGRLSAVFEGDLNKAAIQLQRIRDLAAEPLLGTENLVNAFIKGATSLRGFSEEWLNVISNVAVVFNKDVVDVLDAVSLSGHMAAKSLKLMGITLDTTGDQWSVNGEAVTRNLDAVRVKILEVWERQFPDAVDKAAERFKGQRLFFIDAIEDIGAAIGERMTPRIGAGFDYFAEVLRDNEARIGGWADEAGDAFDRVAADIIAAFRNTATNVGPAIARIVEGVGGINATLGATVNLLRMMTEIRDGLPDTITWTAVWNQFASDMEKAAAAGDEVRTTFEQMSIRGDTAAMLNEQLAKSFAAVAEDGQLTAEELGKLNAEYDQLIINGVKATTANRKSLEAFGLEPSAPATTPPPGFATPPATPAIEDAAAKVRKLEEIGLEVDGLRDKFGRLRIDIDAAFLADPVTDFGYSLKRAFAEARPEIDLTNQDVQDFADETVVDIKTAFTDDFAQGLADMMNGVNSFEESWKGAITAVLEGLQQLILKMMLMAAYQRFIAPLLGGIIGGTAGTAATTAATLAPPFFRAATPAVVIQPQVVFNAGFVDPSGADEFFARNRSRLAEFVTGATVEAIDRSPAFRARVRR